MLARLRHHAFVSGDDQHYKVDAARAGEHVFHKALVAGYVNKTKMHVADSHLGESEIDGYTATFFFGQTIGVDARQSFYQSRLAMIDMPGRADDYFHLCRSPFGNTKFFYLSVQGFSGDVQESGGARFIALGVIESGFDHLLFDLVHR